VAIYDYLSSLSYHHPAPPDISTLSLHDALPISYPDYLRIVARHKLVLQLDRSHVPGQVAGDTLLCQTVCVGGDGAIERIAFPKTCGEGKTIDQIASIALELLKNGDARAAIVVESQQRAQERLSFQAVRSQLATFFARL